MRKHWELWGKVDRTWVSLRSERTLASQLLGATGLALKNPPDNRFQVDQRQSKHSLPN